MRVLGYCLIALPFIGMFILAWKTLSLFKAICIYFCVFLVFVCVALGVYLATGELR